MSDIISKSVQSHFVQGLYHKLGSRGYQIGTLLNEIKVVETNDLRG